MAKKAQGTTATKKTAKKPTAKKTTPKKATAAKRGGTLATTAKRGKKTPKIDPEVEATRVRNRAVWKGQAKDAASIELAKQGALVDERARVRSLTGMSWSNRKPR